MAFLMACTLFFPGTVRVCYSDSESLEVSHVFLDDSCVLMSPRLINSVSQFCKQLVRYCGVCSCGVPLAHCIGDQHGSVLVRVRFRKRSGQLGSSSSLLIVSLE